ncbi:sugar transferase [Candidatus Falkowbacteria bacterium]|nr:sugar transferase [Candidatus Falkowbacteria bacterium]
MKRSELVFSFLLVPLDFLMIVLAGISAYNLRFAQITTEIRPVIFNLPFAEFLQILLAIAMAWLMIFAFAGLYRIKGTKSLVEELYSIVQACSTGLVLVVIILFFSRELFSSRFIVLAAWLLAILYIVIARSLIRLIQRVLFSYDIGVHKVVVVGNSKTADILINRFSSQKASGYEVMKRLRDFSIETSQELEEFLKNKEIDEIIQADPNLSKAEILRLFDFADEHHLTFKYAADLLDAKVLKTEVDEIAGIPIVEVQRTSLEGWGRIIKRFFDIVSSVVLIILTSPITIVTAIIIKMDSRGPVFFSQRDDGSPVFRVGQGGRLFRYFKFRSMRPGTDSMRYTDLADRDLRSGSPLVKIKDDPRVTRIGRFIRRYSIDELAELFLVFRGDMSLVGPRPHLPEEVAKYEQSHKKVLTIKPGITGLAQVSGRSDLSFEEEVKLDTYYIENWSLLLDLSILLKTPWAVLKSRKAE